MKIVKVKMRLGPNPEDELNAVGYYDSDDNFIPHCENGPADTYADGRLRWYWHGKPAEGVSSQEEFERWLKLRIF